MSADSLKDLYSTVSKKKKVFGFTFEKAVTHELKKAYDKLLETAEAPIEEAPIEDEPIDSDDLISWQTDSPLIHTTILLQLLSELSIPSPESEEDFEWFDKYSQLIFMELLDTFPDLLRYCQEFDGTTTTTFEKTVEKKHDELSTRARNIIALKRDHPTEYI